MPSVIETIKHYQRSIDKSEENWERLLHCIEKLSKLPVKVKHLQETGIVRTVDSFCKHDGEVGHAAKALVGKWNAQLGDECTRLYADETENIEPITQENEIGSTRNSDSQHQRESISQPTTSHSKSSRRHNSNHLDKSHDRSNRSEKKSTKNCDEKRSKTHHSSSSESRNNDKLIHDGRKSSEEKSSKRRDSGQTSDGKRKLESDVIDIDSTMGTSFAEALGMLDMPSTSKTKKLANDRPSTSTSTSNKHKDSRKSSFSDETPTLLKKRPKPAPKLDIVSDILPSVRSTPRAMECVFGRPRKHSTQMTDEETLNYNITSRTAKTKVFSGNRAGIKCKVPKLFELCIRILQDNVDLLEFIGGVPFDILRPVLERATHEQLMNLEDLNPYLMDDTDCLWKQHCKYRFRCKSREELETWREMFLRCWDEEHAKFECLTASIKLSKEKSLSVGRVKPTYVDSNAKTSRNIKGNQAKSGTNMSSTLSPASRVAGVSHASGNVASVDGKGLQNATQSKGSNQAQKRSKKYKEDPDWTPTNWYKTLYKKIREPKPPKPAIKKTIDMLRYDRAKALEQKKEEWKKRPS